VHLLGLPNTFSRPEGSNRRAANAAHGEAHALSSHASDELERLESRERLGSTG
jgi:hypothetical protein